MCFAPQRRALFRDLNFQKWSDLLVFFFTFWLPNVLRATTACTFSTSQLPKVLRRWCVLCILTSKCASCHNGVHFFNISTAKGGPKLVCFVHFDFEMCFAPQRRTLFRHRHVQKWSDHGVFCAFWLKCASRHNGLHFFDISTSKSAPTLVCFVHFDFQMCFAPQRRALFQHLNCQKWSEAGVFCTFWLRNVLRATTAYAFSTSQLVQMVRSWCVLYILTSKCASRHNGVHFFNISTAKSGPELVCFVEMCFAPQRRSIFYLSSGQLAPHPPLYWAYFLTLLSHKSLEKHSVSRLSYLFAHLHLLSSDSFSSTLLSSNLSLLSASSLLCFHLSILSEVWLLNFLR